MVILHYVALYAEDDLSAGLSPVGESGRTSALASGKIFTSGKIFEGAWGMTAGKKPEGASERSIPEGMPEDMTAQMIAHKPAHSPAGVTASTAESLSEPQTGRSRGLADISVLARDEEDGGGYRGEFRGGNDSAYDQEYDEKAEKTQVIIHHIPFVQGQTVAQAVYLSGRFAAPPLCSGMGRCGHCRVCFVAGHDVSGKPTHQDCQANRGNLVIQRYPANECSSVHQEYPVKQKDAGESAVISITPEDEDFFTDEALAQGWRLGCHHLARQGQLVLLPDDVRVLRSEEATLGAKYGGDIQEQMAGEEDTYGAKIIRLEAAGTHRDQAGANAADYVAAENMGEWIAIDVGTTSVHWEAYGYTSAYGSDHALDYVSGYASGYTPGYVSGYAVGYESGQESEIPQIPSQDKEPDLTVSQRDVPVLLDGGTFPNPQMGAGSEVVSRIQMALSPQGKERLRSISQQMLRGIVRRVGGVKALFLAANPAMAAITLGYDVSPLAHAPYALPEAGGDWVRVKGLPPVWVVPHVASFVGGDVSAGYAFLLTQNVEYPFILADMGTNGEFILALSPTQAFVTSVALGPALEGINLTYGSEAKEGVIVNFTSSPQGLTPIFHSPAFHSLIFHSSEEDEGAGSGEEAKKEGHTDSEAKKWRVAKESLVAGESLVAKERKAEGVNGAVYGFVNGGNQQGHMNTGKIGNTDRMFSTGPIFSRGEASRVDGTSNKGGSPRMDKTSARLPCPPCPSGLPCPPCPSGPSGPVEESGKMSGSAYISLLSQLIDGRALSRQGHFIKGGGVFAKFLRQMQKQVHQMHNQTEHHEASSQTAESLPYTGRQTGPIPEKTNKTAKACLDNLGNLESSGRLTDSAHWYTSDGSVQPVRPVHSGYAKNSVHQIPVHQAKNFCQAERAHKADKADCACQAEEQAEQRAAQQTEQLAEQRAAGQAAQQTEQLAEQQVGLRPGQQAGQQAGSLAQSRQRGQAVIGGLPGRCGHEPYFPLPCHMFLFASDVEEILKVKAAFSLGLSRLLAHAGVSFHELRHIYLAGALGRHVDTMALENLGFFPPGSHARIIAIGNAALAGTVCLAQNPVLRQELVEWTSMVTPVNLADDRVFHEQFLKHMVFSYEGD